MDKRYMRQAARLRNGDYLTENADGYYYDKRGDVRSIRRDLRKSFEQQLGKPLSGRAFVRVRRLINRQIKMNERS